MCGLGQCLPIELGSLDDHGRGRSLGRIKIKNQVSEADSSDDSEEGDVILHRTLVGELEQRPPVVA